MLTEEVLLVSVAHRLAELLFIKVGGHTKYIQSGFVQKECLLNFDSSAEEDSM